MTLWKQLEACSTFVRPAKFPTDTLALFPPHDNAAHALQLLAQAETVGVKLEVFTYTDKALDAILHAKAAIPGFVFQATFDAGQAVQEPAMAALLKGWAPDLGQRVVTGYSEHHEIIHRKLLLFLGLGIVVGGSTNLTVSGEQFEDNELVIRRSKPLLAFYESVLDPNFARVKAAMPAPVAAAA